MKIYKLRMEMIIPAPIETCWLFFSDPGNLRKITPAEMDFVIRTPNLPKEITEGLCIEYSVRPLLGIRTKWVTEITGVNAPHGFTDEQREGPYLLWSHRHSFEQVPAGTMMRDEIDYALPFSWIGRIAHSIAVRKKLNHIFDFRKDVILSVFGKPENVAEGKAC